MLVGLLFATLLAPSPVHLEFETGVLRGPVVATARAGASGTGYVTGFTHGSDLVELRFQGNAGIYRAKVRYSAPSGQKGFELGLNGFLYNGMFAETGDRFDTADAGLVEVKDGENVLTFGKGWGYYDVDAIDLVPEPKPPRLAIPPAKLVDAKATPEARKLYARILSTYGRKCLSGQYDEAGLTAVRDRTGVRPAIAGGDFIDYSPSRTERGADAKGETERLIAAAKRGEIVTISWHWNAPKDLIDTKTPQQDRSWYRGFYTDSTTFDLAKALDGPDRELLVRDIDVIAAELKKLADAKVPVLWRPLHEAEGGWFWWGAKGPEPFKRLWRLMFDRLVNHHGLHNLIWVTSSGTDPAWYVGDDVVDVVGQDSYPSDPSDPLAPVWEALLKQHAGRKPIALTEFGGVPDVERMQRFGVRFAYFVSWTGSLGPDKHSKEELTRRYRQPAVISLPK